jgi:hypothetical protein
MWARDRDGVQSPQVGVRSSEKTIVSVHSSRCRVILIEPLPEEQNFDSELFMDNVLPSGEAGLALTRPKIRTRGLHLRFENPEPLPAASADSQN